MNRRKSAERMRSAMRGMGAAGAAAVLAGAMTLVPAHACAAAANSKETNHLVSHRLAARTEIENLQRWVAAGHEDWCKDPRLVAAEELKRIAADFAGNVTELTNVNLREDADTVDAKKAAFEWTPLDGRATYRVTVEQFEWLLPIAKNAEAMIWVPTMTEIQIHD